VTNKNNTILLQGIVPGDVYTDLMRAGVLKENPYYGYNDLHYRYALLRTFSVCGTEQLW
jgi:hypothetical protein